ncbi:acyl-CoA dehydrogenase [Mycobacterium sp. CBMA293]|uniref:acyl-CoA dehydrogenase family protein n=1 Tax=unclassified Mycolicibacterium TaxID=2636767 RepID=UPI0012DD6E99|nr:MULTISPECIES: acyl-CoA dehydrogenase family protein [unclassified Mycolicibacterium]MUL47303.1 acyl-CoA dehydrogenase [Mycolicibacterium sp. CBMA 360]MUL61414.1 acyl-CoA dehydrogenase [Mycolicibacterium sp. CBMA 335]MUL72149.1 acyl-CoA dehydrogenase [Mycolicibacterium sp. CBMA 311]MUL96316.1 acyl-CoA dehydrogenase [Mycolicibacterium sp. CBMA 230]MUM08861.1 acyl-CoA dehydrogenase [Mycolicibacterium sp. CBMA 213]
MDTESITRTADRMWHDVFLPDDVQHVRAMARDAVATHLAPVARDIAQREESVDSFPWSAFKGLAGAGCFAVPFERPFGAGLEHPMLATCIVTEEIAYESSSLAGVYDGQCILNARALSFAQPHIRERVLPGLISGDAVFAFATTEPDASSDLTPTALTTVATRTADGFIVNGRKRWITNSIVADWVCVLCRDGDTDQATMLLIDMHSAGIQVGEPDLKMGHRGQITADIVFDNVSVPADHALGEPGRGLATALASLAAGRLGIAAAGVGVAQIALDLAVARLRSRELFGRKLGEMQYWQYKLAERATELEAARSMYQKAAVRIDRGDRSGEPEASMAKSYATHLANDLARDALQIYGGYGFARRVSATGESYRLEEIYRDAKILEIFEGANEVLQWVIARQLIGRDITG